MHAAPSGACRHATWTWARRTEGSFRDASSRADTTTWPRERHASARCVQPSSPPTISPPCERAVSGFATFLRRQTIPGCDSGRSSAPLSSLAARAPRGDRPTMYHPLQFEGSHLFHGAWSAHAAWVLGCSEASRALRRCARSRVSEILPLRLCPCVSSRSVSRASLSDSDTWARLRQIHPLLLSLIHI